MVSYVAKRIFYPGAGLVKLRSIMNMHFYEIKISISYTALTKQQKKTLYIYRKGGLQRKKNPEEPSCAAERLLCFLKAFSNAIS